MIKHEIVKDGPYFMLYTWEIDLSKPWVWLDGCYYRFNKDIIKREQFKTMEDAMSSLNAIQTESHEPV